MASAGRRALPMSQRAMSHPTKTGLIAAAS